MDLSKLEQQALNTLLKNEVKYSKQIQKALLDALTSIYGEMTKIYDKYAVNGLLTKVEMTKYNKYQTMEKQILDKLDPALKTNIKSIKKLLPEQFQQSFFNYAWAIDNATGLRLSWGLVNLKTLLQPFDITNPKNIELQNALKNYTINGKKALRSALLNNLSQGKSYAQMIKDLKRAVEITYNSAKLVIRTEGQSAINNGQDYAYLQAKDKGIEGNIVWSTAKDSHVRPEIKFNKKGKVYKNQSLANHRETDGQVKNKDGLFYLKSTNEYARFPGDPNLSAAQRCNERCTERFEIEGYSPQLMRTREEGVLPYQNFNDYAKEYHPEWLKN
jgi:hypothetical protein